MEQDFLIKLQAKLDEAKAKTGITEDIKKIQNQIDSLKLQVSIDEKSIQNVMRQLDSVLNQKNVGRSNIGDGIQKSVETSLQNVRKLISDTFKNLPKLNASDLISKFNLNSKDIDAGVVTKVRNITQELNKLASKAVDTNSDNAWQGVIKNIRELGETLNQFGKVKADTSQYENVLKVAEQLKKTKIYVDPSVKNDVLAGTNVSSLKELNNELINMKVSFTSAATGAKNLDAVWDEFINSTKRFDLSNITNSADRITAIVNELRTAKDIMYGNKAFQSANGYGTEEMLSWLNSIEQASKKMGVYRQEEVNLERQLADTVVQSEKKKQDAIKQTQDIKASQNNKNGTDNSLANEKRLLEFDAKRKKILQEIATYLSQNSKLTASNTKEAKELQANFQKIRQELQNIGRGDNIGLSTLSKQLATAKLKTKELGLEGSSMLDKLGKLFNRFNSWFSVGQVSFLVTNKIRMAVREIKELDTILTEISKTSDLTTSQLNELGDSAFGTASKYGKKASDYLTGVQEMYRAGYDNAKEMAELSILAQSAGSMDATTANDYLIATDAAYELKGNVEALNEVLDSQNYITNNAAVSMDDMASATKEAASIASQYGVEVNELSSLIAVAASKTRESGSEVGTALKSIFVNLQDTTNSSIVKAFETAGVSMTEMVNGSEKLKTPIALLKELSDVFTSLEEGSTVRATILNDIGGKYHANTLSAILSDWSSYEKMMDLYSQGEGSAFNESQKSAQNLEAALNRINNTITDIVNNVTSSKFLTDSANGLNEILSLINQFTDKLGALGTISVVGAGIVGANRKSSLNLTNMIAQYKDLSGAVTRYNALTTKAGFTAEKFNSAMKNNNTVMGAYLKSLNGAKASFGGYIQHLTTAKISTIALSAATTALNMALSIGTAYLISSAITALAEWANQAEHTKEALEESVSAFEETTSEIQSLEDELKTCAEKIEDLQKLADAGTISVADEDELETLKKTNDELERKIALKKAEQIEEYEKVLDDNKDVLNNKFDSEYKTFHRASGAQQVEQALPVTTYEELGYAIDEFEGLNYALEKGTITQEEYDKQIQAVQQDITDYAKTVNTSVDAYDKLIAAGITLQGEDLALYNILKDLQDRYLLYNYALYGTAEAYKALSDEQKKKIILDRLEKQGLSEKDAEEVYNAMSDEQKDNFYEIDFKFKEPDEADYKTASAYGKAYVQAMFKSAKQEIDNSEAEISPTPFLDKLYTEDYEDTFKELQKLAEAGELTPKTLSSTHEYNKLLKTTGVSAKEACEQLYNMIDANTRLSAFSSSMGSVDKAYAEFKTNGYNTIDTLSGMQGAFGDLSYYDKFIQIAGNAKSSTEDIQQAYEKLVSEYVYSTGILDTVNESNKGMIQTQLEQLGITNAEEIVTRVLNDEIMSMSEAKAILIQYSLDLSTVTAEEINKLITEGKVSNATAEQIATFALKKKLANGATIKTDGDIANLVQLANVSADVVDMLIKVANIKERLEAGVAEAGTASGRAWLESEIANYNKKINKHLNKKQKTNIDYTGGTATTDAIEKANKSATKSTTKFSQAIDWCVQTLSKLGKSIDLFSAKLESNTNSVKTQIKYYKQLLNAQNNIIKGYAKTEKKYNKKYQNSLSKLSDEDRKKVEDGTYTIEQFSGKAKSGKKSSAEKRYNKIQNALEARDNLLDAQVNLVNAQNQFEEYAEALVSVRWENATEEVEKLNSKLELLELKASNAVGSLAKNSLVDEQLANQKASVMKQRNALKKTQSDADSVYSKISSKYKKNTKADGTIKTKGVTDKKQLSYIKLYNAYVKELADDTLELAKAEEEYKSAQSEALLTKTENIQSEYDMKMGQYETEQNRIQDKIALAEAQGKIIGKAYYTSMIASAQKSIPVLEAEMKELQEHLATINPNTNPEEWYEVAQQISECSSNMDNLKASTEEWNTTMQEIETSAFDDLIAKFQKLNDEADFYVEVLENSGDLFDKDGNMTELGNAKLGLLYSNYLTSQNEGETAGKKAERFSSYLSEAEEKGGVVIDGVEWTLDELENKITSLKETQQDAISSMYDYKDTILDLIEEGINAEIEATEELIEKKKEALESERELDDFRKKVADSNQDLALIERQLSALEGDNSDEARKKRRELEAQKADEEESHQELLKEQAITMQTDSLDEALEQFKSDMEEYLETVKTDLSSVSEKVNENLPVISETLKNVLGKIEYIADKDISFIIDTNNGTVEKNTNTITKGYETEATNEQKKAEEEAKQNVATVGTEPATTSTVSNALDTANEQSKLNSQILDIIKSGTERKASEADEKKKNGDYKYRTVNRYLIKKHGYSINKKKQAEIAQLLGMSGATEDNITNANKQLKLSEKLKLAGFSSGGLVKVDDLNSIVKANGDDGIATVKKDEYVLTPIQSKSFIDLAKLSPDLLQASNALIDGLKFNPMLPTNIVANRQPQNIDNSVVFHVNGNPDNDALKQMEKIAQNIVNKQQKEIQRQAYNRGMRLR